MNTQKKKNKFIIAFVIFFSFLLSFLPSLNFQFVYAEDNNIYSNVLEDLTRDENFNIEKYPEIQNKYTLEVIQIAESTGGELFVYVYQPCTIRDLKATSVNFSTGINANSHFLNYELVWLNSDGVFHKYKVKDFVVKKDVVRYYDISSIFRLWNSEIDKDTNNDNTIQEVSFEVGKFWTACTLNGNVTYTCVDVETIKVTEKYVGSIRYLSGWNWVTNFCDSHFVAFSTDKPMDKILEAELSYVTYPYVTMYDGEIPLPDDMVEDKLEKHYVLLTNEDKVENKIVGLFGEHHDWDRIESVTDFIANENLKESTKNELKNKQWVLRFAETPYEHHGGNLGNAVGSGTGVKEVTILRLKFDTAGVVYNLGVVDNKQSGDNIPDNVNKTFWDIFLEYIMPIIIGIVLIIGLVILSIFTPFLSVIWNIICCLAKAVWWLIKAPFSLFIDN